MFITLLNATIDIFKFVFDFILLKITFLFNFGPILFTFEDSFIFVFNNFNFIICLLQCDCIIVRLSSISNDFTTYFTIVCEKHNIFQRNISTPQSVTYFLFLWDIFDLFIIMINSCPYHKDVFF